MYLEFFVDFSVHPCLSVSVVLLRCLHIQSLSRLGKIARSLYSGQRSVRFEKTEICIILSAFYLEVILTEVCCMVAAIFLS